MVDIRSSITLELIIHRILKVSINKMYWLCIVYVYNIYLKTYNVCDNVSHTKQIPITFYDNVYWLIN